VTGVIRYIVIPLHRIYVSTIQRFNDLTRRSRSSFRAEGAMTIIELLVVIIIIFILAGLVLSISSYVQDKGKRARAETEIAAMSAALESYKADNGIYPDVVVPPATSAASTLDPATQTNPNTSAYQDASLDLYKALSGDSSANRQPTGKSYFSFSPRMLSPKGNATTVTALVDPWGKSYGYSTAKASNPSGSIGNNPTYDLWSTAGTGAGATPTPSPAPTVQNLWIKNW
jgi:type II secretory pathway pseudopilin PulG